MAYADYPDQQPGLEVAQSENADSPLPQALPEVDGLHPLQTENEPKYTTLNQQPPTHLVAANENVEEGALYTDPDSKKKSRTRFILIAVGCLLVITGAIVGGVVGSRGAQQDNSGSNNGNQSPSTTSITDSPASFATTAMTGSPTSVTAGLAPTAISHGYPHLEIFAVTNNKTYSIYRKHRDSNATSSTDFFPAGQDLELVGGSVDVSVRPSIAVSGRQIKTNNNGVTNRTELHHSGIVNKACYRKYHDSDELWSGNGNPDAWDNFDVPFSSSPTQVDYNHDLDIMKTFFLAQGKTGLSVFYYQYYTSEGWSNAIPVQSGDMYAWSTPAVVAWAGDDSRLDVFVVSRSNNHLMHVYMDSETGEWSDYEDLKGFVTTPPVAISRTPGTLDVFARGGNGGLWHLAFSEGHWANWTQISGSVKIQGQPDAISISNNTIDVVAWGEDGSMLHKRYDTTNQQWTPQDEFEVLMDKGLAGPPRAMTDGTGDIQVFAYSDQGKLLWKTLGSDAASKGDVVTLADVPMIV